MFGYHSNPFEFSIVYRHKVIEHVTLNRLVWTLGEMKQSQDKQKHQVQSLLSSESSVYHLSPVQLANMY